MGEEVRRRGERRCRSRSRGLCLATARERASRRCEFIRERLWGIPFRGRCSAALLPTPPPTPAAPNCQRIDLEGNQSKPISVEALLSKDGGPGLRSSGYLSESKPQGDSEPNKRAQDRVALQVVCCGQSPTPRFFHDHQGRCGEKRPGDLGCNPSHMYLKVSPID